MKSGQNKILIFVLLQISVIIYTMAGVCSKLAASVSLFSVKFILLYGVEILILGIYAVLWQQIIKKTDIFVAYANKGTSLLWSLLWAIILFSEKITLFNVIGIIIVMTGVILISTDSGGNS